MAKYDRYTAKSIKGGFGESKTKKTPYCEVIFEVTEGPDKGRTFPWQGYLSDATTERTIGSLRLAGCTFPKDDITDLSGLGSKVVDIQVEQTDFGPRVAWVNESGGSSLNEETTLGASAKKALAAQLKGTLLSLKGGAVKAKPKPAGEDPFKVEQGAANENADEQHGKTGTDDVPF